MSLSLSLSQSSADFLTLSLASGDVAGLGFALDLDPNPEAAAEHARLVAVAARYPVEKGSSGVFIEEGLAHVIKVDAAGRLTVTTTVTQTALNVLHNVVYKL